MKEKEHNRKPIFEQIRKQYKHRVKILSTSLFNDWGVLFDNGLFVCLPFSWPAVALGLFSLVSCKTMEIDKHQPILNV